MGLTLPKFSGAQAHHLGGAGGVGGGVGGGSGSGGGGSSGPVLGEEAMKRK